MRELFERAADRSTFLYRDLHIILDALPTPLSWASISDGKIHFINGAFVRMFGYGEKEFATVNELIDRTYVQEASQRETLKRWRDIWDAKEPDVVEIPAMEVKVRCADGAVRTVQFRSVVLRDMDIEIATFEDISDRKLAEDALRRIAIEDPLTGLPNRRVLLDTWLREMAADDVSGGMAAILAIDLDGFKLINDSLGHDAGDEALVVVAKRLRESVRASDLVCRSGGDEFVILMPRLRVPDQFEQICWRIVTALALPFDVAGQQVSVGASIGASLFPQDGKQLTELVKYADQALYRLTASEKGGWAWFKPPKAA